MLLTLPVIPLPPRVLLPQNLSGCLTPAEVCEGLGLPAMHDRKWHVQSAVAIRGERLYEGLDWLEITMKAADGAVKQR
jgi:Arf/Sar family protein